VERSGGQEIELVDSGDDFAVGTAKLPLFNHMHGFDAGEQNASMRRMMRLMDR